MQISVGTCSTVSGVYQTGWHARVHHREAYLCSFSTDNQSALTDVPDTIGSLIIESLWAKKRVSTGALEALDDPLVVQMKI